MPKLPSPSPADRDTEKGERWRFWPRPSLTRRHVASLIGTLLLVDLWLLFLAPASLGGPLSLIWVSGVSMEPTLRTGDLAVLYERGSYDVGQIVAFEIPEGGTVIHRVVRTGPGGYRFRGDNREQDDPWILNEEAIRGQQIVAIPGAAKAMTSLGRPPVLAGLAAALVVLLRLKRPEREVDASTPRSVASRLES